MGASRPFRQAVKCGRTRIASQKGADGPARGRGPARALDGLRRLLALQVTDDVGDVGDLLLEIALVLLEPAKPFFAARETPVPEAEATMVSMSVHAHLPSSYLSRNWPIVPCARTSASAQRSSKRRPSAVSSYVRLAGPGRSALHSERTSPSSSSERRSR